MEILNFPSADQPAPKKKKPGRAILGIGIIAAVAALSSTLAANININSGPVEFGQGVAQTVSCGDSEVPIIVTPSTTFTNSESYVNAPTVVIHASDIDQSGRAYANYYLDTTGIVVGMLVSGAGIETGTLVGTVDPGTIHLDKYSTGELTGDITFSGGGGTFAMSSITLSDIPAACNGKVFTIKVYDNNSSTALPVTNWDSPPDNSFQLWWANGYSNPQGGTTPDNYAMLHFAQNRWFTDCYSFDSGDNFLETAAEDHGSSLASGTAKITLPLPIDATRVYKITLETQDDSASFVDRGYDSAENTTSFGQFWADYIW